ncbi:MAG TPA: M28 family metallopeptidase [Sphingomonas sp.]|nr:M28 family metallopeptidase [Sphingomonas sp.]
MTGTSTARGSIFAVLALAAPAVAGPRGDAWWHHVQILAADDMRGRQTGSNDYLRAADYVIGRFKALGLQPAGSDGFLQPVDLIEQSFDPAQTALSLSGGGLPEPLRAPDDMIISAGGGPAPESIDAPLVFAGYGLGIAEAGHDDFAGLDLRGKIVVVIAGGPPEISGALKSNARSERARRLAEAGAVGMISLVPPGQIEIPWPSRMALSGQPAMYLADSALRDMKTPFFSALMNTARSETLFAGSGHSFAEMAALADASRPVPTFALARRLSVKLGPIRRPVRSANIIARLPGRDPKLAGENVVISAHLDHHGVQTPVHGDAIYNGAMDDAAGVATAIEIAAKLRRDHARPRRSILFAIVTAEEKGLLGSHYFAMNPTVPRSSIVADLNFDMPLPLWKLTSVIVLGREESSLVVQAQEAATAAGLALVSDPLPDRNSFVRSDQYSFIRAGIPSVAFKFGFVRGTPEETIEKNWRATRYHAPSDDLNQPVEKEEAVKLNDYVADMALRVANAPSRPAWSDTSIFRRFAAAVR